MRYLGYYTDAGAYYYYNTEPGMNYEARVGEILEVLGKVGVVPFSQ